MLTHRLKVLLVVAALLLSGCFRRDAALPNVEPLSQNPTFRMQATLGGDLNGTVAGESEVSFIHKSEGAPSRRLMGWAAIQPVPGAATAARFALTIKAFGDDGTYRIPRGGPGEVAQGDVGSTVQMFWFGEGAEPDTSGLLFERRAEECTVEVARGGHNGTLRCPQLVSEDGQKRASVDLEWQKV